MKNLVVDIGNTLVKLAVFEENRLIEVVSKKEINKEVLDSFFLKNDINKCIYSSVRSSKTDEILLKMYNFLKLTHLTRLPLQNHYKTPETLGLDRIAGVIGAQKDYKNTNLLVIDLGTCITFDFVNSKKEYLGGAISPGFEMRFKALNYFTKKLPIVKFDKSKLKLTGNTTESSIVSGVYNGVKNEIEGIIRAYDSQYESLKIVVTGGDINLFDLEPKNRIFADEFLVLKGLNEILNYNED